MEKVFTVTLQGGKTTDVFFADSIKDLSSKKGFENGQFIRLAVRDAEDNNKLLAALKEILN